MLAFGVRRCRCATCRASHALLPAFLVAGRMDFASAIGTALAMGAVGRGHRPTAALLGVPETTVRGWLRRLRARAAGLRALFVRLALQLGAQAGRSQRGSSRGCGRDRDRASGVLRAVQFGHARADLDGHRGVG